jgi:hypothetical protein
MIRKEVSGGVGVFIGVSVEGNGESTAGEVGVEIVQAVKTTTSMAYR